MDWITQPGTWIAFFTLVALELVLGVDNVIFISILAGNCRRTNRHLRAGPVLRWQSSHAYCSFYPFRGSLV